MPVNAFLEEFFPNPPDSEMGFGELGIKFNEINFGSVPDSPSNEGKMYRGLVSAKLWICCLSDRKIFLV